PPFPTRRSSDLLCTHRKRSLSPVDVTARGVPPGGRRASRPRGRHRATRYRPKRVVSSGKSSGSPCKTGAKRRFRADQVHRPRVSRDERRESLTFPAMFPARFPGTGGTAGRARGGGLTIAPRRRRRTGGARSPARGGRWAAPVTAGAGPVLVSRGVAVRAYELAVPIRRGRHAGAGPAGGPRRPRHPSGVAAAGARPADAGGEAFPGDPP